MYMFDPLINQFYNWSILIMQYYLYLSELKAFTFTQQKKNPWPSQPQTSLFSPEISTNPPGRSSNQRGKLDHRFHINSPSCVGNFCWKRDHHCSRCPIQRFFISAFRTIRWGWNCRGFFGTPKKTSGFLDGKTLKLNFVSQNNDEKWTFLRRCSRTWWRTVPTVQTARHVCQFQLLELIEPVRTCSELWFFSVQRKMQDPSTPNGYQGVPSRQNVSTCLNASSLIQVMKIGEIHTTTDLSNTSKYPLILWGGAHLDFHQECLVLVGITLIWIVE